MLRGSTARLGRCQKEGLLAVNLKLGEKGVDVVTYKVCSSPQFGGLPRRSAVDLAACVLHDIEKAKTKHHAGVSTLLTKDVSGAFNAVYKNRLVRRLRTQGWDPLVCIRSTARLDGIIIGSRRA